MTPLRICHVADLLPDAGVAALVGTKQVALFYLPTEAQVFALSNFDPLSECHVISQGLLVEDKGEMCVSAPLYKQRYLLESGICVNKESAPLQCYRCELIDNHVVIYSDE